MSSHLEDNQLGYGCGNAIFASRYVQSVACRFINYHTEAVFLHFLSRFLVPKLPTQWYFDTTDLAIH